MKVLQLCSGGFDSVAQALHLHNQGQEVGLLYIKFRIGGGKQSKEIKHMLQLAENFKFKHYIIKQRIKKEDYDTRDRQLVKLASDVAREHGYDCLALGTSYYPNRQQIADIDWADLNPKNLEKSAGMPVITLQKEKNEILKLLTRRQRKYLFNTTSCQLWFNKECGRCYRCAERHAAFLNVLGYDKTVYSHNPKEGKHWEVMHDRMEA